MKTPRINLLLTLTIIISALSTFVPVSMAANSKTVISKKEFKVLLRTAKEPPEHQKIAQYYRQEAKRLTASSKEHEEMAEIYAENPPFPAMDAKHGDAFGQGESHCQKWAQLIAEQAKEAEALAALHEDMARRRHRSSRDGDLPSALPKRINSKAVFPRGKGLPKKDGLYYPVGKRRRLQIV